MQVAIEVERAFQVEERGNLSFAVDALNVGGGQRQLDLVVVLLDLRQGKLDDAEGVLGLVPVGVVRLGRVDREEHRVEAAFDGAGQVDVSVLVAVAHVEALEQLAAHPMDVRVHDKGVGVEIARRALGRTWIG